MKTKIVIALIGLMFLVLESCQKEISRENETPPPGGNGNPSTGGNGNQPPTGTGKLYRIRQGIHQDITEDTVLLISYHSEGKVRSIVDSLYKDSSVASYDASGKLTTITRPSGDNLYCLYDSGGLLTEIGYKYSGERNKLLFTYNNGIIAKQSYYTDLGMGGEPKLRREYLYTVTVGNITKIDELDPSGRHLSTDSFEYGPEVNQLKDLSLFNYGNWYGLQHLANFNSYFNKNFITKITSAGSTPNSTTVYTLSSQQLLSKVVVSNEYDAVFTWQFYYR